MKQRESEYPKSEHIQALEANGFVGGDFVGDLKALRENRAIKMTIGRGQIPASTAAGDFCRCFSPGHILQIHKAFAEIYEEVYIHRDGVSCLTIDVDAKVHEVYGKKKQGAAKSYNGVYSFQPIYVLLRMRLIGFSTLNCVLGIFIQKIKQLVFLEGLKRRFSPL